MKHEKKEQIHIQRHLADEHSVAGCLDARRAPRSTRAWIMRALSVYHVYGPVQRIQKIKYTALSRSETAHERDCMCWVKTEADTSECMANRGQRLPSAGLPGESDARREAAPGRKGVVPHCEGGGARAGEALQETRLRAARTVICTVTMGRRALTGAAILCTAPRVPEAVPYPLLT